MHTTPSSTITDHRRPAVCGFSLIELVLVLAIISILAAIAVPRYAQSLARYRADAAARRIVADLNYARQLARSSSASVTVNLQALPNQVTILSAKGLDSPSAPYKSMLDGAPYYADLVSSVFGADESVIFNGYGDPDSGGTAVVSVGSVTKTVVLDPDSGKAVVQ